MKKLISGCVAVMILSATAVSASRHQPAQQIVTSGTIVTDTVPGDTNRWKEGRRDTSMNMNRPSDMNPSTDSLRSTMPDSTRN